MQRSVLKKASKIVVKVGTSSITDKTGNPDISRIGALVEQVARLRQENRQVILVTSGAVGTGMNVLNQSSPPASLYLKQALAAVGQGRLIRIYEKLFSRAGLHVAQFLLTPDTLEDPARHQNAFLALHTLLGLGVVPVINENDAVACEGFQFGDNDSLSAVIARIVGADLLVILSDIDGLYEEDPRLSPGAALLRTVEEITSRMEENSRTRGSGISSGGMFTKLQAAKFSMDSGILMVIANGGEEDVLLKVVGGEDLGTLFVPPCRIRTMERSPFLCAQGGIAVGCTTEAALPAMGCC